MSRRKKSGQKIRFRIYAFIVLLIILLTGLVYLVVYSDFFTATSISADYSILYERSDLIKDLKAQAIGDRKFLGLLNDKSILFWYFAQDEFETPEHLPYLQSISIDVDIASKSVNISTVDNDFTGILCKSSSECYAFNENGVLYSKAPYVEGSLILKVVDQSDRQAVLGHKFLPEEAWIERIVETVSILKDTGVNVKSVSFTDLTLKEWRANLFSDQYILFNFDFVPDNLSQVIENFLQRVNGNFEYIDLRVPGRIFYQ